MNITIVELPEFIHKSEKLLSSDEHDLLLTFLATHPTVGFLLQGTEGVRKLR